MPCPSCGVGTTDEMCSYHDAGLHDSWSDGNRIVCDLIHRGKAPRRLSREAREDLEETQTEAQAQAWSA